MQPVVELGILPTLSKALAEDSYRRWSQDHERRRESLLVWSAAFSRARRSRGIEQSLDG